VDFKHKFNHKDQGRFPMPCKEGVIHRVEQGNPRADSDEETGMIATKEFIETQEEDGVQARGSLGGLHETRCEG
jgi:hypothetical protein